MFQTARLIRLQSSACRRDFGIPFVRE